MTAANDVICLAVQSIDVATMTDPHFRIDSEVVLFVGSRPKDHFPMPERCSDPKLSLALNEPDTADFLVSTRQSINYATTFRVGHKCLSNLIANSYKVALFVDIACCDTLFHWDFECDICCMILYAPEADQVFGVYRREVV